MKPVTSCLVPWMLCVPWIGVGAAAAEPQAKAKVSTPADIIGIMEKSKITYALHPPEDLKDVPAAEYADRMWPSHGKGVPLPYIEKGADGKLTLVSYPVPEEGLDALHSADAFFEKKEYDAAQAAYLDVLKKFPDYYRAHLYLGDIAFVAKQDSAAALAEYREAIRLNPYDYTGFLFAGHALAKLGRNDEALESLIHALTLRAYQETTLGLAASYSKNLGITPHPDRFQPKAFVRKEGDKVGIYVDAGAHWLAWATCKAVWLAEPSYREAHGVKEGVWSTEEDRECTAHLLILYASGLKQGKVPHEAQLDRLLGLRDDKLLTEFVIYEFGSRFTPDTLLLVNAADYRIEDYVRKYVLPKTPVAALPPN